MVGRGRRGPRGVAACNRSLQGRGVGATGATHDPGDDERELRNDSGKVMRGLDRGESFVVTRNGAPVGELIPLQRRRFVATRAAIAACAGAPGNRSREAVQGGHRPVDRSGGPAPCTDRGLADTSVLIELESIGTAALPEEARRLGSELGGAGGGAARDGRSARTRTPPRSTAADSGDVRSPSPFDADAARAYGQIYAAVRSAGRKAGGRRFADLLIAATALAARLPLYTRNAGDFSGLEDLLEVVPVGKPQPTPDDKPTREQRSAARGGSPLSLPSAGAPEEEGRGNSSFKT